ncbi:MAG: riboflavin biosynthesis protein RibF, partial [Flavobacteriales bacterium]|nr:riboflavin biosynthesis protein RibF [Flavobacteriales bacterium]
YSAVEYVRDFLVNQIQVHTVVVGYDHHFGRNREGNFDLLLDLADTYGFKVREIPAREIADCKVSSTKIRNALWAGDVQLANDFLGYRYHFEGTVVDGNKIGRKFGFPTVNLIPKYALKLVPGHGVYAVNVFIDGLQRQGMMNIGTRPTVSDGKQTVLEVHILDWDEEIYGKDIALEFVQRIRNEMKFESTEALIERLHQDRDEARHLLA